MRQDRVDGSVVVGVMGVREEEVGVVGREVVEGPWA